MSNDIIKFVFGPDFNGQTIDDGAIYDGDSSIPDWQDTCKFSNNASNITLRAKAIHGGTEDCVDINNGCTGITVDATYYSGGKYVCTIKDSTDVTITGMIVKGGSEVDIDLGNWSDQGTTKTTGVKLGVWKQDGSPVVVRVLNASKPEMLPLAGPIAYAFPHPDAWYHGLCIWWFMKFHRFFR